MSVEPSPTQEHEGSAQPTPGPWIVEETAENLWVGYPKAWAPKVSEVVCSFQIGSGFTDAANARNRANARLTAAAPDYHKAAGGGLDPAEQWACGPLSWLRSAIDTLSEPHVRKAVMAAESDPDPDAYAEMISEVQRLHDGLQAAVNKAEGR